ncbi:MAG: 50S ribosomal protein L23 [Chloroflexi bacterium]|nr:50S ribosomal protein L23 [Chloroflexota bacterium]
MDLHEILKRPLTTEKTTALSGELRQYSFEVDKRANKHQVKEAVEKMFKVQVVGVNVLMMPSRQRRWGRIMGRKAAWKKAIVTLQPGDSISFFEGV